MTKARNLADNALTTVSPTELGYLDGVTSAVQTQINSKIGSASAINPTIVDVKGDIIAATAADTVARLAVGANDTVLTADSSTATGLKWATPAAGGMTLLSTTALSGTSTSITGISGSYKHLFIQVQNAYMATEQVGRIGINATTVNTDHAGVKNTALSATFNGIYYGFATSGTTIGNQSDRGQSAGIWIYLYSNTSFQKSWTLAGGSDSNGANVGGGLIKTLSAISSLQFTTHAGSASWAGGQVLIYGVN